MISISGHCGWRGLSSPGHQRAITSGLASYANPAQAHLQRMRAAAPNASGFYRADDYTASLSQAGLFVDAFGGGLTYGAPNVMASPTRAVDPISSMAYVASDGADDTTIAGSAQVCAAYTLLFRSAGASWSGLAAPLETEDGGGKLGLFGPGSTEFLSSESPRAVRRNGTALAAPFSMAPVNQWMVATVYTKGYTVTQTLQMFAFYNVAFVALDLAEMLTWAADPVLSEVQTVEQEMMDYYSQRYGLTF